MGFSSGTRYWCFPGGFPLLFNFHVVLISNQLTEQGRRRSAK